MRRGKLRTGACSDLLRPRCSAKDMESQPVLAGLFPAFLHAGQNMDAASPFDPEQQNGFSTIRLVIVENIAGLIFNHEVEVSAGLIAQGDAEIGRAGLDEERMARFPALGEFFPQHIASFGNVIALFGFAQVALDPGARRREQGGLS